MQLTVRALQLLQPFQAAVASGMLRSPLQQCLLQADFTADRSDGVVVDMLLLDVANALGTSATLRGQGDRDGTRLHRPGALSAESVSGCLYQSTARCLAVTGYCNIAWL